MSGPNLMAIYNAIADLKASAELIGELGRGWRIDERVKHLRHSARDAQIAYDELSRQWPRASGMLAESGRDYDRYVTRQDRGCSCHISAPCSFCTEEPDDALPEQRSRMNIENIKRVRDHIAALPDSHFDMRDWGTPDCGTAACIGGWTERLLGDEGSDYVDGEQAGKILGLTRRQAGELFYMDETPLQMGDVTRPQAVAVLDHLIATGKVDWDAALSPSSTDRREA